MAYQSDGIDPGLSPTLGVFNDATVSGHIQGIKLIDPTVGSTTPIGTSSNPMWVHSTGSTGSTVYHAVAAGSNNAAVVKNAAGSLVAVHVFNNAAYPVYVKLYNKATSPTPASDTPVMTIGVQAGTARDALVSASLATGIGIAIVKGIADTDNTSVVASDAVVDVEYV